MELNDSTKADMQMPCRIADQRLILEVDTNKLRWESDGNRTMVSVDAGVGQVDGPGQPGTPRAMLYKAGPPLGRRE